MIDLEMLSNHHPLRRSTVIDLDMLTEDHAPVRKTKIIVTIGSSSSSPQVLERLVDAGMDVAMFRFTHGQHEDHSSALTTLRKVRVPVAAVDGIAGRWAKVSSKV